MKYYWWIIQIILMVISIFFLVIGIDLLIGSYSLKNPFYFIMTFFASSLMILISLALFISFIIKMVRVYKRINNHTSS